MKRTDELRERTLYNSLNKNRELSELLRYRGLLENESESVHNVKRAKVIRYFLTNYPVEINEGELLIGRHATGRLDEAQKEELMVARDYIKRADMLYGAAPASTGHRVIDYEKVLREGVCGILEDVGRKEKEIVHTNPDAARRTHFYAACRISLEGLLQFAAHYRDALAEKSSSEKEPLRKAEYVRLTDIFSRIPFHPARDFYEALQCVWFMQLALSISDDTSLSGRPDQYLYSFYLKGITDGSLTREFAMELIEGYYLKINEIYDSWPGSLIVGGVDRAGNPVYNELTEMFINAIASVKLVNPSVAICYNEYMPEALLMKCVEVLAQGYARPSIFNDRIVIDGLLYAGMRPEDARSYIHSTCVEMTSIGCSNIQVATPYINTIKGIELLLNDDMEMNGQPDNFHSFNPGIHIELASLTTFNDFLVGYLKILAGMIQKAVIWANEYVYKLVHYASCPLTSCFTNDCIEKGMDTAEGGARYNFVYPCFPGFSSTVDALNAVREVVYERKMAQLGELKQILETNYSGEELFRQYLINRCPKYGNDLEQADELAMTLYNHIRDCLKQYRNCLGGSYHPSYFAYIVHGIFGRRTAATADGRLCGEALSECIGPVQGMDRKGPTAVLNSIAKLEHKYGIGGIATNFRFGKAMMDSPEGKQAVANFIREFMRKGGFEIQLNVIDQKTLIDAKDNPEKYRTLIVRVAGYSDYFINLDPVIQDEIIKRTEHGQI